MHDRVVDGHCCSGFWATPLRCTQTVLGGKHGAEAAGGDEGARDGARGRGWRLAVVRTRVAVGLGDGMWVGQRLGSTELDFCYLSHPRAPPLAGSGVQVVRTPQNDCHLVPWASHMASWGDPRLRTSPGRMTSRARPRVMGSPMLQHKTRRGVLDLDFLREGDVGGGHGGLL